MGTDQKVIFWLRSECDLADNVDHGHAIVFIGFFANRQAHVAIERFDIVCRFIEIFGYPHTAFTDGDGQLVEMIFEKIMDINKTGVSMIIVEQNAREALKMADHGYVLAMGKNVLDDTGEALLANEEIGRLYLGG